MSADTFNFSYIVWLIVFLDLTRPHIMTKDHDSDTYITSYTYLTHTHIHTKTLSNNKCPDIAS